MQQIRKILSFISFTFLFLAFFQGLTGPLGLKGNEGPQGPPGDPAKGVRITSHIFGVDVDPRLSQPNFYLVKTDNWTNWEEGCQGE